MLKIVRGLGPVYGNAEPVLIDNRVYMPTEDEETGEIISPEEQRRREEAEKAEEERRFNEAVDAKIARILDDRAAALERERSKIVEDAKAQANGITADARAAAMAAAEKAERECIKIKEAARIEGHGEGFAEGKAEALEKYRKYVEAAGDLLSEINSRKEAYYISHEEELRKTVFAVAEKVVHAELKASPQVIDNILADAAKNFRNSDFIKIILKEEDITERYRTDEKLINKIIPFIPEIEIVFDEDAEDGTIVLDNGSEIVDASIPTQLDFLKEILQNTRGESDSLAEEGAELGAGIEVDGGAGGTDEDGVADGLGGDIEDGIGDVAFADVLAEIAAGNAGADVDEALADVMAEAAETEQLALDDDGTPKKTKTKKTK